MKSGAENHGFIKEAKSNEYLLRIVLAAAPASTGYTYLLLCSVGGRISSWPRNLTLSLGLRVQEIFEMGHLDLWKDWFKCLTIWSWNMESHATDGLFLDTGHVCAFGSLYLLLTQWTAISREPGETRTKAQKQFSRTDTSDVCFENNLAFS